MDIKTKFSVGDYVYAGYQEVENKTTVIFGEVTRMKLVVFKNEDDIIVTDFEYTIDIGEEDNYYYCSEDEMAKQPSDLKSLIQECSG